MFEVDTRGVRPRCECHGAVVVGVGFPTRGFILTRESPCTDPGTTTWHPLDQLRPLTHAARHMLAIARGRR